MDEKVNNLRKRIAQNIRKTTEEEDLTEDELKSLLEEKEQLRRELYEARLEQVFKRKEARANEKHKGR